MGHHESVVWWCFGRRIHYRALHTYIQSEDTGASFGSCVGLCNGSSDPLHSGRGDRTCENAGRSHPRATAWQAVRCVFFLLVGRPPSLDVSFTHPFLPTCPQYVFADVMNQQLYTTTDYGRHFSRIQLDFRPREISMHSRDARLILAYDKEDPIKRVRSRSAERGTGSVSE